MRPIAIFAFLPLMAAAQAQSEAVVRGILLERDAGPSGEFAVRAADNEVYRYRFDSKTYVEAESQMIDVARLKTGEKVEVVSDKPPQAALRYALTVHVLMPPGPAPPRLPAYSPIPRDGNLSFSGLVVRIDRERLVLRTRQMGDQTFLLRQDTKFLRSAGQVDAAQLKPNTMVYVKAGKTLYGDVEAYQVVWGAIPSPR